MKHNEKQHPPLNDSHDNALETALRNILKGNKRNTHKNENKDKIINIGLDQTFFRQNFWFFWFEKADFGFIFLGAEAVKLVFGLLQKKRKFSVLRL